MASITMNPPALPEQPETSTSHQMPPLRLLVKNRLFIIESAIIAQLSPIFARVIFCAENNNPSGRLDDGKQLIREIVDESSDDIATFLNCCSDPHFIDGMFCFAQQKLFIPFILPTLPFSILTL